MLVVTFPVRAAAIVVVAAAASAPPPASFAPPLELPEPPDELPDPPELPEPPEPPDDDPPELLELLEGEPASGGVDEELLPQANRSDDANDAAAREIKAREVDFIGARP